MTLKGKFANTPLKWTTHAMRIVDGDEQSGGDEEKDEERKRGVCLITYSQVCV